MIWQKTRYNLKMIKLKSIKNKLKKRGYETIQVNDKSILAFSEV